MSEEQTQAGNGGESGQSGEQQKPTQTEAEIRLSEKAFADRLERAKSTAKEAVLNELKTSGRLLDETSLEDFKKFQEESKQKQQKDGGKTDDQIKELMRQMNDQKAEFERERALLQQQRDQQTIDNELFKSLSGQKIRGDINRDMIKTLITANGNIKVEDGKVVVADANGNPLYSKNQETLGEPMGLAEYVDVWLRESGAIFLEPAGVSGSGTRTNGRGATGTVRLPDNWRDPNVYTSLSDEQRAEVRRLSGMNFETQSGSIFTKNREKQNEKG